MRFKKGLFYKTFKKVVVSILAISMLLAPISVMASDTLEMFEITRQVAIEQATAMMEMFDVPGLTMAVVDVDSGFTWTQGLGYADVSEGVAVTEHTLFDIGSTSKPFTAVAIMQLVEAGLLDLDEPIITYLPEFSMLQNPLNGGDYRNITTRMLLTHTSGIHEFTGEYHASVFARGRERHSASIDGRNREAMNDLFSMFPYLHMQNQELNLTTYNNTGYILLAILVARLSGAEYYFDGFVDFTQENIFGPTGMALSGFEVTPDNKPYVALAHYDAETPVENFWFPHLVGEGGMVSNAADMARFMHIMLNGGLYGDDEDTRILQSATIDEMIAVEDEVTHMLGFMHRRHGSGAASIGHAGSSQHQTDMFLDFENGIGVFVSVNSRGGALIPPSLGEAIWQAAVYEKTGVPVPLNPLQGTPFIPESLEELVGWYTLAEQLVLNEDGVLVFPSFQGLVAVELNPIGNGFFEFAIPEFFMEGIFSFRKIGESLFLYAEVANGGAGRVGERMEPTLAPESFERWVGRWGTIDEEGNEELAFTLGINENGFAYSMLFGVSPFMEGVVDDYTIVTLGRSRMHGGVRVFSVEDGVPTVRYSGEVYVMLSDVVDDIAY
ncbi:MAG: beta-lactamase family protein [Defluviitaleaceae bacterium]|nr:beta-lactamase family protein [Defluviitaleaceae bacterium]